MNTRRLNITIPIRLMDRLKSLPNKSAFIAEAIREKLEARERLRREEELARAYRQEALEEGEPAGDWDRLAGEGL